MDLKIGAPGSMVRIYLPPPPQRHQARCGKLGTSAGPRPELHERKILLIESMDIRGDAFWNGPEISTTASRIGINVTPWQCQTSQI